MAAQAAQPQQDSFSRFTLPSLPPAQWKPRLTLCRTSLVRLDHAWTRRVISGTGRFPWSPRSSAFITAASEKNGMDSARRRGLCTRLSAPDFRRNGWALCAPAKFGFCHWLILRPSRPTEPPKQIRRKCPAPSTGAGHFGGSPYSLARVKRSTSCFKLAASAESSSLAAALSWAVALLVCTTEEIWSMPSVTCAIAVV